jgi:hypothetical protein
MRPYRERDTRGSNQRAFGSELVNQGGRRRLRENARDAREREREPYALLFQLIVSEVNGEEWSGSGQDAGWRDTQPVWTMERSAGWSLGGVLSFGSGPFRHRSARVRPESSSWPSALSSIASGATRTRIGQGIAPAVHVRGAICGRARDAGRLER